METNNEKIINDLSQKNPVYKLFLDNNFIKTCKYPIIKTQNLKNKNGQSDQSLQFDVDCLKDVFDLKCDSFCRKYTEAISGLEGKNIFTLHSSALLALLFFSNISEDNPLKIHDKSYCYLHLEHKNPIYFQSKTGKHYTTHSNIDVVLSDNQEIAKSKNILFLESKFSEYTHCGNVSNISMAAYGDIYDKLTECLTNIGIKFLPSVPSVDKGKLQKLSKNKENQYYCEGLKQMICHYIGAKNYANQHKEQNLALGSILFHFNGIPEINNYFDRYSRHYNILIEDGLQKILDKDNSLQNLTLFPKILTYQEVYSENNYILPKTISDFYKLERQ